MFTLFHLIFTLVKIFFQTTVYATLLLIVFRLIANGNPNSEWDRLSKNKSKFWFKSGFVISIILFIFSFTYWGDHGLGDSSRLPVGHFKTIHQTDDWAYFYTRDNDQRHIYNFEIRDDKLFAEQDDNRYLIFDLESEDLKEFNSKEEYEKYARQNNLPLPSELKKFFEHYKEYWNGWRFWFLP